MKKLILSSLVLLVASPAFAADETSEVPDIIQQACAVRGGNGAEMLNLAMAQWGTIPSDGLHDEVLMFENGQKTFINQQAPETQQNIKDFYDKDYDVYVCVDVDGNVAPVYVRMKHSPSSQ
ncbi:hypothetical protein HPX47_004634 [Vibrio alginolyticus]|nr:hypothetical protein [Vibrio alginolyticus]